MGHKKKLLCACGDTLLIDSTQAGSMLRCHCGEQIQVPTLREIAQLPDAKASEGMGKPVPRRWTRTQGILFAIGAACLLLTSTTATLLLTNLPESELPGRAGSVAALDRQLDRLSPQKTLELWQFYEAAPAMMIGIEKKTGTLEKRRVRYTLVGWIVGIGGLVTGGAFIFFSLRGGKPQRMA